MKIIYYYIKKFNSDWQKVYNINILLYIFTELTDTLLTAQAVVFFIAGFETSSSTIAFGLYELAQNQEIKINYGKKLEKCTRKIREY